MTTRKQSHKYFRLAAPVLLGSALLVGCGGGTEAATGVPSLSGDSSGDAVTTTTIDSETAVTNFVACLREQGLDVADPTLDADGNVDIRSIFESAGLDPQSTDFQTAREACQDDLGDLQLGGGQGNREDRQQATLAFTSCLRAEGLDVGDLAAGGPGAGGGGAPAGDGTGQPPADGAGRRGGLGGGGDAGDRTTFLAESLDLDPTDPTVEAALTACESELGDIGGPGGAANANASTTTAKG